MRYPIAIEHGDDKHAFGVVVPDLPGCFSAGDTIDEAIDNVKEVIELWIETVIDEGDNATDGGDIRIERLMRDAKSAVNYFFQKYSDP